MLHSDCLRTLSNNSVFLNPRIACIRCRNHSKIPNFVPASSSYGGFSSKQTKSPLKWGSYGGCIPSILVALETFADLDDAFEPWEGNLSCKERTIILKEQTNWRRALSIFDWFKNKGCYELNVIHYNVMLKILGRAQRWDHVRNLWREMQFKCITPTNSTYGTLIDVFSKGGLNKEALLWLGEMYKQGMEPDEVTMGIVVQTYKKAGEFQKAEQFFKKWSSDRNDATQTRNFYGLYTFNTLIDTYGKAGQLKEASDAFAQMLKEGIVPDIVTFNTIIHVSGNNGQLEEVDSLMELMKEIRCDPDTRTYNILISLYAKHDDITTAAGYFSKMKEAGLIPDIILSEAELPEKGASYVRKMQEAGLVSDCIPYSMVMTRFAKLGKLEQAEDLFDEMVTQGIEPDIVIYSILINAFSDIGSIDEALNYVDSMKHVGFALNSIICNSLIKLYTKAGYLLEAQETYKLAKSLDGGPDVYSSNCMIDLYCENSMVKEAEEVFTYLKHRGDASEFSYAMMLCLYKKIGLVDEAYMIADEMHDSGLVTATLSYNSLIRLYTSDGRSWEAIKCFRQMVDSGAQPDDITFKLLATILIRHGASKEAANRLELIRKNDAQSGVHQWIEAVNAMSCLDDNASTLVIK
ncbi:pentatricopeptide repeat-containing protein At3g23020 isoform X2 [Dioscorea cayenensis subsp. rotundata]|uniref:Pentatricopeptide repeat-containing protein At3g23020 isoform X2 n=1 Tax=Dioscorea cayennensis subsp. rotundata TaxID=55577 RepID=A0AB40AS38_DIOCR|nr:pentatricopeptide repeat-containing protein At3g23020 isoform X2 [Dioscorea cayenensis subsp. rotundata]